MQATVSKSTLHTGLGIVSGAAAKKPSVPVLANVLLDAQQGGLTMTTTDLERYVVCRVRGDVAEPGAVTLPARLSSDVVSALPDGGAVSLITVEFDVELACGDARSKLDAIPADEFPHIPDVGANARSVGFAAHEFADAVEQVIIAVAQDESRPILTGVLCQFKGHRMTLAAADGFRLAVRTIETDRDIDEPFEVVIPAPAMADAAKFSRKLCPAEALVMLDLSEDYARFDLPIDPEGDALNVEVIARLLEGKFPDYKMIIPSDQSIETMVTVNRESLLQALKLPTIFAKSRAHILELEVQSDGVIISAGGMSATDVDGGAVRVAATVSGAGLIIAVNSVFLKNAVESVTGDQVVFDLTSYNAPVRLRPATKVARDSAGYHVHVIMPMMTTEMRERAARAAEAQIAAEKQAEKQREETEPAEVTDDQVKAEEIAQPAGTEPVPESPEQGTPKKRRKSTK